MTIHLKSLLACQRNYGSCFIYRFLSKDLKDTFSFDDIDKKKNFRDLPVPNIYLTDKKNDVLVYSKAKIKELEWELAERVSVLKERNIVTKSKVQSLLFAARGSLLRKQISFLEEGGITVSAFTLGNISSIVSRPIVVIKGSGYMRKDIDVPKHILSQSKIDVDPPEYSEDLSYETVQRSVLLHCIKSHFNMTLSDSQQMQFKQFCALRDVIELLTIFENDLHFSRRFILKNLNFLNACPRHVSELLTTLAEPYSLDSENVISKCPNLLFCLPVYVKSAISNLHNHGFTAEQVTLNLEALTLHPFVLENDLQFLSNFKTLPNEKKMKLLGTKQLENKLSLLTASLESRTTYEVSNRTRRLYDKLVEELSMPRSEVMKSLKPCPRFVGTSVDHILEILDHLRSSNYSDEAIKENLLLLLYDWTHILNIMEKFDINENSIPDAKIRLRLCIYYILQEDNFSWWISKNGR